MRRRLRFAFLQLWGLYWYGDRHFITAVNIEISKACNRRCDYCPVSKVPKIPQEEMSEDMQRLVIRRLVELRWRGIIDFIMYNEPLLSRGLDQFARDLCHALPYAKLHLTTNGDLLTPDRAKQLIQYCGIRQFNVTRHPPYTQKWDENMRLLKASGAAQYIRFISSPGIEGWTNRGGLVIPPGPNCITKTCIAPQAININIRGQVLLCCNDFYQLHVMGSLESQSIRDIYYNKHYSAIRRQLRKGKPTLPICRACMKP